MYIYKTTNLLNGKIYIGLSTKKVDESTNYYGSGMLIKKAIKAYGLENFSKEILERDITDRKVLCQLEKKWIKHYKSNIRGHGYNLTNGGDGAGGHVFTAQRRANIGKANSKKKTGKSLIASRKNMLKARQAVKNFTTSEETKAKISQSIKGRHWYHNPENPNQNGQYHTPPEGWIRGRGKRVNRPSNLTYKKS